METVTPSSKYPKLAFGSSFCVIWQEVKHRSLNFIKYKKHQYICHSNQEQSQAPRLHYTRKAYTNRLVSRHL